MAGAGAGGPHGAPRPALGSALGAELEHARLNLGLTVREAAARAGISPSYLRRLQKGEGAPSTTVAENLVNALELSDAVAADLRARALPGGGQANPLTWQTGRYRPRPPRPTPPSTEEVVDELVTRLRTVVAGVAGAQVPLPARLVRRLRRLVEDLEGVAGS